MPKVNKLLLPGHEQNRCTGRTTAMALNLIAGAINNQGQWAVGQDHHGGAGKHAQAERLGDRVRELIAKLDLKHIVVEKDWANGCVRVRSNIWLEV